MTSVKRVSRGYKGFAQLAGKWVYEPIQRYFSPPPPERQLSFSRQPVAEVVGAGSAPAKFSTVVLPDGAKLAYEILGSHHLGKTTPIVMICGMTALRSDDERVNSALAESYPVLVYDHRGMGDSSLSSNGDEEITIELLARDLIFLLTQLKWKKVALCGHSMGGVIAQQLLVIPYHLTDPVNLPFRTTHLILVGTRCKVSQGAGLPIKPVPGKPRSLEERREGARRVIAATLDPAWIQANNSRFDYLFSRVVNNNLSNRPAEMIAKQSVALRKFDFERLLDCLPREIQVMIIHGQLDQVIPISCANDIMEHIPWARSVEEGIQPGQVPTLKFGHLWYEYFDPQVWHDVLHTFMQPSALTPVAKERA